MNQFNNAKEIRCSGGDVELWKSVIGYEGRYEISNYGRLASLETTINNYTRPYSIMKPGVTSTKEKRYLMYILYKDGIRKNITAHKLVALHFLDMVDGANQINHIDGVKSNNYYKNLEWVTASQNITHALENRLISKGVTPKEKRIEIVDLYNQKVPVRHIVEKTGINRWTIFLILKNYRNGRNVIF